MEPAAPDDASPTGPQRTCVGCRATGGRSVLLRLAVDGHDGATLVLDPRRRMPGRGLWLHPDEHCLALAVRRKALARALRRTSPVAIDRVVEQLRAMLQDGARPPGQSPGAPRPAPRGPGTTDREQNADEHPMSTQR